jgi:hypothetical protein
MDATMRAAVLAAADTFGGTQPWQCVHHDWSCLRYNRRDAVRIHAGLVGLYESRGHGDEMPPLDEWIAEETGRCRPGDPRQAFPGLWELIDRVEASRAKVSHT